MPNRFRVRPLQSYPAQLGEAISSSMWPHSFSVTNLCYVKYSIIIQIQRCFQLTCTWCVHTCSTVKSRPLYKNSGLLSTASSLLYTLFFIFSFGNFYRESYCHNTHKSKANTHKGNPCYTLKFIPNKPILYTVYTLRMHFNIEQI